MKLRQLEMALESVEGFINPLPGLEQYQTPATLAARLLYHAHSREDIAGLRVCDLGCGTGSLAIGASLLGARHVVGIDIDEEALTTARKNAGVFGVPVQFIHGDIRDTAVIDKAGPADTVIMNPPFGAQQVHADRPFIDRSLELAPVVYGIFNTGSRRFIESYISGRAVIDEMIGGVFPIRRIFFFHTRDVRDIAVEIFRLKRV